MSGDNPYACRFRHLCSDIARLQASQKVGRVNEDLIEQWYEVCSVAEQGGIYCLLRDQHTQSEEPAAFAGERGR